MHTPKYRWYGSATSLSEPAMHEVTQINLELGLVEIAAPQETRDCLLPFDESTLMAWTGLRDKNDIEIFEGDIVLVIHDQGCHPFAGDLVVVEYSDRRAMFLPFGNHDCSAEARDVKIVGNVHETPQLIPEDEQ